MAKKSSSKKSSKKSSKISVAKATTVKVPSIKSYTPSKAVTAAQNQLKATENAKPAAYNSKYGTQITDLANAIANRKGFKYDFTKDALYQNYKDQYTRQAQIGMQNATAQAAALSGGYGNSYAATAGNLAYQENMAALNNVIPSLYEAAYNRYNMDLENQRADLSMYQGLEDTDYARYRDEVGDWQNNRDYYAGRADAAYNKDFDAYGANVSNKQWMYEQKNANAQWKQQQDASNYWQKKDFGLSKKEQDSSNYWKKKEYELAKKAKTASVSASGSSRSGSGSKKTSAIPADIKAKVKSLANDKDKKGIVKYLNNMEKNGLLTAEQSDYLWEVTLGYTKNDLPSYTTSDGTKTTGMSKYPTYDSAIAAGADSKTTLSYVDFMKKLPNDKELQKSGSYSEYLEKQVKKAKKSKTKKKK
ncbi:MAG: hypothetical protein MR304_06620 [Eubacterium sp.]|nr:hypothetical protein [Eubacterium sp.]